jgi:hypothetical protein
MIATPIIDEDRATMRVEQMLDAQAPAGPSGEFTDFPDGTQFTDFPDGHRSEASSGYGAAHRAS